MKLNQLSIQDLEGLFFKIYENACELIDEAELLYKHQKYARSYLCSHSAFEEFGKIPMLHRAAIDIHMGKKVDWKSLNKRIRAHSDKISLSSLTVFYFDSVIKKSGSAQKTPETDKDVDSIETNYIEEMKGIITGIGINKVEFEKFMLAMDFKEVWETKRALTLLLKDYREGSLYADYHNKDFLKPSERIDRKTAEYGFTIAYMQKQFIDAPDIHNSGFQFVDEKIEQTDKLLSHLIAKQLGDFAVKQK